MGHEHEVLFSPMSQAGFLSLGSLEAYCHQQPYSPFFTDLTSDNVVTTLTAPAYPVLYLATALCREPTLRDTLNTLEFEDGLVAMVSPSGGTATNLGLAFPASDSAEGKKRCYQLWRATVCEILLALCALQPSKSIQQSQIVSLMHIHTSTLYTLRL